MKNKFYLCFVSIVIIFSSCDYISNPCPEKNANLSDTATCPNPTFSVLTTHTKKILIEDYTGHICPNCPRAARKLHDIDSTYPGKIIGIGIHFGTLSAPSPGHNGTPSTAFTADFRTSVGDVYGNFFGISFFPVGMINRKDYTSTTTNHLKTYITWQSIVSTIIADSSVVDLQIAIDYDASSNKMCCAIKDSFLTTLTGSYRLVALLIQDSIINWQDDIDQPAMVPNYVHRHVLRDAITPTGAWGESLIGGSANAGLSQIRHFAYTIPTQYNSIPVDINKCYIVAFIYNTTTYEIIQSEESKIIP